MKTNRFNILFTLCASILLLCSACTTQSIQPGFEEDDIISTEEELTSEEMLQDIEDKSDSEKIKVALLLPISTKHSAMTEVMLDTAQFALYETKADNIEILPYDTKGTSFGAIEATKKAVDEGCHIILGPVFNSPVNAVAKVAKEYNIPVITFSNNEKLKNKGVFLMGLSTAQQVEKVMDYTMQNKGYSNFSAILPTNAYGASAGQILKNKVAEIEGKVIKLEFYPKDAKKFKKHTENVVNAYSFTDKAFEAYQEAKELALEENGTAKDVQFIVEEEDKIFADAILVIDGGDKLNAITEKIPEQYAVIGINTWYGNKTLENQRLNGGWFASPDPTNYQIFEENFNNSYAKYPIQISALVYDSIHVINEIVNERKYGSEGLLYNNMIQYEKFEGINGIFRFKEDGTVKRTFGVLGVEDNGFTILEEANKSFTEHSQDSNDLMNIL